MTPDRIKQLRELCEKLYSEVDEIFPKRKSGTLKEEEITSLMTRLAKHYGFTRTAMPELLDEVERLQNKLTETTDILDMINAIKDRDTDPGYHSKPSRPVIMNQQKGYNQALADVKTIIRNGGY